MFKSRTHYITHFRRLINLERDADIDRHEDEIRTISGSKREKKGRALLNMRGKKAGHLHGNRQLVKFMKSKVGQALPELDMRTGDVVLISQGQALKKGNPLGTIVDTGRYSITVMFEGQPDKWMFKAGVRVDLYVNDVTYRRMQEALDVILYARENSPTLMEYIIGEKDQYIDERLSKSGGRVNVQDDYINEDLNASQKEAVVKAVESKDFYIVHGPPGTGKTITGVEILSQLVRENKSENVIADSENIERKKNGRNKNDRKKMDKTRNNDFYNKHILATADSNGAVDNIAKGLVGNKVKVVRIGQPFKVNSDLIEHTLDAQLVKHERYHKVEALREKAFAHMKDQQGLKHPSPRWTRGLKNNEIHKFARKDKGSRGVSSTDMKQMSKWLHIREEIDKCFKKSDDLESKLTQEILRNAEVILATNSGSGQAVLEGWEFDVVLIDEATQSTESSAIIPAVKAKKLILLGDHKQLPPTVLSLEAERNGFGISLLERLIDRYDNKQLTMLNVQYRMNEDIMAFPNKQFYEGALRSGENNKSWSIGLKEYKKSTFLNISGKEKRYGDGPSLYNSSEVDCVVDLVEDLLEKGIKEYQLGIISPYKAQVHMIRTNLEKRNINIQTDSVDGFQGQEKDVIIISLVRCNDEGNLGFLKDTRRLNVALTRARKLRIVVGNQKTLSSDAVYKAFIDSNYESK